MSGLREAVEALANDLSNPHAETDQDFSENPVRCIADALHDLLAAHPEPSPDPALEAQANLLAGIVADVRERRARGGRRADLDEDLRVILTRDGVAAALQARTDRLLRDRPRAGALGTGPVDPSPEPAESEALARAWDEGNQAAEDCHLIECAEHSNPYREDRA